MNHECPPHHWAIEAPDGSEHKEVNVGTCRKCGETKEFPASLALDFSGEQWKSKGLGKKARRRPSV